MQYADIAAAVVGTLLIASIADLLGGRRGYFGAALVAGIGAACGAFLAIRVFALATLGEWTWVIWALAGAALSLGAYVLLRNKR